MPPPPVLDHIEKTFADQYRKEIDQEENVWRSLPFFAATLALQSVALAQFRDQLFGLTRRLAWVASVLALFVTLATVTALVFLALAIRWAKFAYIASEPALLAYAQELEAAEQATSSPAGEDAATVLKRELVRQYAAATSNNRAINQRRVRHRTSAGMATLVSVLATILLLAARIGSPYLGPVEPRAGDAAHDQPAGAQAGGARAPAAEAGSRPGDAAADARGRAPMRVVEKGWFTLRETTVPVEEVERWNDERRRQGRREQRRADRRHGTGHTAGARRHPGTGAASAGRGAGASAHADLHQEPLRQRG